MGQKNGKRLSSSTGYQKDLIADYAEGVAQKRGHYLKVIKEINKFSPKTLKELILDYVKQKMEGECNGGSTVRELRKYLVDHVKPEEFVETLHLFCWQFISSSEFSNIEEDEPEMKDVISYVLGKIAANKSGLIRRLMDFFDDLMTNELVENLEYLIQKHSDMNIDKKTIFHIDMDRGEFGQFVISYIPELTFNSLDEKDKESTSKILDNMLRKISFLKEFVYSMFMYFLQFLDLQDEAKVDLRLVIDEKVNKILYSTKSNLRSICLYFQKMISLGKERVLREIQQTYIVKKVSEMEDIQHLEKVVREMAGARGGPSEIDCDQNQGQLSSIEVDVDIDNEIDANEDDLGRPTIKLDFKNKCSSLECLDPVIEEFGKQLCKCQHKNIYFSVHCVNTIYRWILMNFGPTEKELQIDVARAIIRKAFSADFLHHFTLLNRVCIPNSIENNQFFQLFLACLDSSEFLV